MEGTLKQHPPRDVVAARFGDLLVSEALIPGHDLAIATEHSGRTGVWLADAVVDLGFASEPDAYAALASFAGLRPQCCFRG